MSRISSAPVVVLHQMGFGPKYAGLCVQMKLGEVAVNGY